MSVYIIDKCERFVSQRAGCGKAASPDSVRGVRPQGVRLLDLEVLSERFTFHRHKNFYTLACSGCKCIRNPDSFFNYLQYCSVMISTYTGFPNYFACSMILMYFMGRVGAPLTVVPPSQNSGRAAFPHPALCETNRSHYHSYILTYIRGLTSG